MNSMTGMGRVRKKIGSSYLLVEIKSVNHRYSEIHTRLPSKLQFHEIQIIQLLKKKIARGKVDIWIGEERVESELGLSSTSLKAYYNFLTSVKKKLQLKDEITLSHIQAGMSQWMTRDTASQLTWPSIKTVVEAALKEFLIMRSKEGKSLKTSIMDRVANIKKILRNIESSKDKIVIAFKEKLEKRISKLLSEVSVDQGKLANELAYYADRSDITEEIDRLNSHFKQLSKMFESKNPIGRQLDFLVQEMNREFNTIGSKSQGINISHLVVDAKGELEKIREQVQNIE